MMTTRVSDCELAENLRRRNRLNSERRRQRLAAGGMVQLLAWIPNTLRSELDSVAAARGEPLSETTTVRLSLGLKQMAATKPTAADLTADLSRADRDRQILELKNQGLSNPQIGLRFNISEGSVRRALKRMEQDRQP